MESEIEKAIKEFGRITKVSVILSEKLISQKMTHRLELSGACLSKMMVSAASTLKLMPQGESNLDLSLISAAGRSVLELSNNCFFYGAEAISIEEQKFRQLVFEYSSIKERKRSAEGLNASKSEMEEWELTDEELRLKRNSICAHPLFSHYIIENKFQGFDSLINPENNRNKYNSRETILHKRGLNVKFFKPLYSIKSSLLHNSPSAITQHIHYLRNYSESDDPNIDLSIAVSLATVQFCLYAKSIEEINSTFQLNLFDEIEKADTEIITNYSNNFNTANKS